MKRILSITYFELLKNIRDIKLLLILVVSPLIFIFILGNSLDSFLSNKDLPTPVVGYINNDQGSLSDSFNNFLNDTKIKSVIELKNFNSLTEANIALENGEITSIIYINENYSEFLSSNLPAQIEITGTKNSTYVEAIVNNYVNSYNLTISLIKNNIEPSFNQNDSTIERGKINSDGSYPTSMDYYSIQTLLQILMICSVLGISIILRDNTNGLNIRINSLPINKYQLIIGRLFGSIIYSFIAAIVTILFSKYVYHANWNGNLFLIGGAILLFVIISIGIGILLAYITKSYGAAFGIIALLSFVFAASVGAFSPKTTMKSIAFISPNNYAKNIILGSIYKLPINIILEGFIGLLIMIIIIYGFIFIFEGRKKYANI